MPVSRITLSTAMRARDGSRPRAADLAEAAEAEDALAQPRGLAAEPPDSAEGRAADGTAAPAEAANEARPVPPPSRRQRRRTRLDGCPGR